MEENKKIMEMMTDMMEKLKGKFDESVERGNMVEIQRYSEAMTEASKAVVQLRSGSEINKAMEAVLQLNKLLDEGPGPT